MGAEEDIPCERTASCAIAYLMFMDNVKPGPPSSGILLALAAVGIPRGSSASAGKSEAQYPRSYGHKEFSYYAVYFRIHGIAIYLQRRWHSTYLE